MHQYNIDIFSYSGPSRISSSDGKHNSGSGPLCIV